MFHNALTLMLLCGCHTMPMWCSVSRPAAYSCPKRLARLGFCTCRKVAFAQEHHLFHVLVEDGLTFLCMAEEVSNSLQPNDRKAAVAKAPAAVHSLLACGKHCEDAAVWCLADCIPCTGGSQATSSVCRVIGTPALSTTSATQLLRRSFALSGLNSTAPHTYS